MQVTGRQVPAEAWAGEVEPVSGDEDGRCFLKNFMKKNCSGKITQYHQTLPGAMPLPLWRPRLR